MRLRRVSELHLFGTQADPADKEKGGTAEAARPKGDVMLNIDEKVGAAKQGAPAAAEQYPSSETRAAQEDARNEAWLRGRIADARNGVITETINLTPSLARVLLARNPENRRLSPDAVEKYERDIGTGQWALNGEPVIVSREGFLNDGQHRCQAVLKAGRSIRVVFVVGPERESRFTLDQGRVRTVGDYLGMNGIPNADGVASTAVLVWQWKTLGFVSHQQAHRPTKTETLRTSEQFPEIISAVQATPTRDANLIGGRTVLAFARFAFSERAGRDDADFFISRLWDGANLGERDPILYARNRLIQSRSSGLKHGTGMKIGAKAELLFRAWNAHRLGEKPKTLQILNEKLPPLER